MKAIGARNGQLAGLYFTLSAAFGVIAFLIAVPLSYIAAAGLTQMLGGQLNVDIVQMRLPWEVVLMQALTSVGMPAIILADVSSWRIETDDLTELVWYGCKKAIQ